MTNDLIQEIYLYAIQACQNGQLKIPVYIFPFKMTKEKMGNHQITFKQDKVLIDFWTNLKMGYDTFEKHKKALTFDVGKKGHYIF
jgi:murein L,D-transpeptidase YafK